MTESFATYAALPDVQKRQLCLDLLAEFGVDDISESTKGELRHRCSLPLGGHTDRDSVTASINYKKLTFRCLVCNNAGGLLWWIAVNRGESVARSRDWLRSASGVTEGIDPALLLTVLDALFHPASGSVPMPSFDERTLTQWCGWPMQHPYLTEPVVFSAGYSVGGREIPTETLDRFKVGYCDHDPHWGYSQRTIIPVHWQDSLVGWQARRLLPAGDPDDPDPARYKNSPDFPRDRVLYGSPEALRATQALLVESPMSVLRHSHHLPVVATLGASVSDSQLSLLHRYDRVSIFFDNDQAGWDAVEGTGTGRKHRPGLVEKLREYVEVRVVDSPWWKADPADLTEQEVAELYAGAQPAVLWKRPDVRKLNWYSR